MQSTLRGQNSRWSGDCQGQRTQRSGPSPADVFSDVLCAMGGSLSAGQSEAMLKRRRGKRSADHLSDAGSCSTNQSFLDDQQQPARRQRRNNKVTTPNQRDPTVGSPAFVGAQVGCNMPEQQGPSSCRNQTSRKRGRSKRSIPAAVRTEIEAFDPHKLSAPTFCHIYGAKKFQHEANAFCCSNGEVRVATNSIPPELERLFRSRSEDALHFQTYSRLYNNLFAFSALGGTIDCKTYRGIYVFRLHGQIYHFLPNLLPNEKGHKYLQLYFYDSQQEHETRNGLFQELRSDMIHTIMQIMDRNPYARFFRSLQGTNIDENTTIRINKNPCLDQRVYNAPSVDEVAAIWCDQSATDENEGLYIAVSGKSGKR